MAHPGNRVLKHMTISYAVFLLIPVVMGSLFLYMAAGVLHSNLLENNARHLSFGATMAGSTLEAANEAILAFSQNETVIRLVNGTGQRNSYDIRHAANSMPRLHTANGIVSRYFFYYHNRGTEQGFLMGPQTTFLRPDMYYRSCFQYQDMDSESFWAFIHNHNEQALYPAQQTRYLNSSMQSILMVSPFPTNIIMKPIGHFLIYFDQAKIMQLFAPLFESGMEWLGMYDENGALLVSSSDGFASSVPDSVPCMHGEGSLSVHTANAKYILQYFRDPSSGWMFVAFTPERYIAAQSAPMLGFVVGGVSIFILVAMCLIWMLTRNSQRPLKQIAELLPMEADGQSGLWPMKHSVEKLLSSNQELSGLLNVRSTQLRDASISQLVKGSFEDEQELSLLLKHTGVEIEESDEYRGVYLKLLYQSALTEATLPHLGYRHTVLSEALSFFSPALQWLTLKNERECILLYTRLPDAAPLEELMASVYTMLKDVCGTDAALYVGTPSPNLRTLHQSFSSAKSLSASEPEGEKYLFIAEWKPLNTSYDYTGQDEATLLSSVQRGEMEKVSATLADLYERNFHQRNLSSFTRQGLFSAMLHTLSRADCPVALPPELMEIPLRLDERAFFDMLEKQYEAVCLWIQDNRHRGSRLMLDNVLAFMDENYTNPDMSLTYAAMHFGLTEQYLSEGFKRRAGINFSTYLEQKRIQRAQELLRTTQQNVQLIAETVGYANIRTFRRAYSRVLGHPPSADRKEHVEGDIDPNEKWRG